MPKLKNWNLFGALTYVFMLILKSMHIENYLMHLQEMVLEILLKGKIKKRQYPAMVYLHWCLVYFYEKHPDSYIRLDFRSCKQSLESFVLVFDEDD